MKEEQELADMVLGLTPYYNKGTVVFSMHQVNWEKMWTLARLIILEQKTREDML